MAGGRRVDVSGLSFPESVTVGPDGKYYVSNYGPEGTAGKGSIAVISGNPFEGTATVSLLTTGMNHPTGAVFVGPDLYVADASLVWKVPTAGDMAGQKSVHLSATAFPTGPRGINDLAADGDGNLFMSDSPRRLIFKVSAQGAATLLLGPGPMNTLRVPNGVLVDAKGVLSGVRGSVLVVDFGSGILSTLAPDGSALQEIARNFGQGDGLAFDAQDNLYISDYQGGTVYRLKPDRSVGPFAKEFTTPADLALDQKTGWLIVPNFDISTVTFIELQ
jgi:sugar lactone lactonase YvrE